MKIRRILENSNFDPENEDTNSGLDAYEEDIRSFDEWLKIKKSGKYNPNGIRGNLYTNNEKLTSLEGSPEYIYGGFVSEHNLITNLIGGPKWVSWNFDCNYNKLISFEGAPEFVGKCVYITNNKFESLQNIHKHFKTINNNLYVNFNPIKSNILGILLIKSLKLIYGDGRQFKIIQKHLNSDRDVLECQEEMISAGYKEFAKL